MVGLHGCHNLVGPDRAVTWKALSAGLWYSCGVTTEAETFCWGGVPGYRTPFPLKDSLMPISALPLRVPSARRFIEITVGESPICALDSLRAAYCWGANQMGEVGDSSNLAKRGPSRVVGSIRWRTIAGGSSHVCGIALDGAAYCWGDQFRGALGDGQVAFTSIPWPECQRRRKLHTFTGLKLHTRRGSEPFYAERSSSLE
jgi:alpha-tubulin suppressor-like RCC1 family protein